MFGKGKPKDMLTAPWPPNVMCRVVCIGALGRYCQLRPSSAPFESCEGWAGNELWRRTKHIGLVAMEPLNTKVEG